MKHQKETHGKQGQTGYSLKERAKNFFILQLLYIAKLRKENRLPIFVGTLETVNKKNEKTQLQNIFLVPPKNPRGFTLHEVIDQGSCWFYIFKNASGKLGTETTVAYYLNNEDAQLLRNLIG